MRAALSCLRGEPPGSGRASRALPLALTESTRQSLFSSQLDYPAGSPLHGLLSSVTRAPLPSAIIEAQGHRCALIGYGPKGGLSAAGICATFLWLGLVYMGASMVHEMLCFV